jgi:transposase InsO family protein
LRACDAEPKLANPTLQTARSTRFAASPPGHRCRQGGLASRQEAWRDNVFVERLWRSIKYEEVYLRAYDSVAEARTSISRYLAFYNGRRPHSSLDRRTPDQAYFIPLPQLAAA